MEAFYKTWELRDQDFDKDAWGKIYKAWDLNMIIRKIMESASKPLLRVKESAAKPGEVCLISRSARSGLTSHRSVVGPVAIGGTCEVKRPDGKVFTAKIELVEPNKKFVQTLTHNKNEVPTLTIIREIDADGFLLIHEECGGHKCTRVYQPSDHVESKEDEAM